MREFLRRQELTVERARRIAHRTQERIERVRVTELEGDHHRHGPQRVVRRNPLRAGKDLGDIAPKERGAGDRQGKECRRHEGKRYSQPDRALTPADEG